MWTLNLLHQSRLALGPIHGSFPGVKAARAWESRPVLGWYFGDRVTWSVFWLFLCLDGLGFESWLVSSSNRPGRLCGPPSLLVKGFPCYFPGLYRPRCEVHNWRPSSGEIRVGLYPYFFYMPSWLATGLTVWGLNPGVGSSFSAWVQTGPEAHPASCSLGPRFLSRGLSGPELAFLSCSGVKFSGSG